MPLPITDDTFEAEIVNYKGVALVDFWAPWCGPCQAMGPIIDNLAEESKDFVKVAKVNVDENPQISQKYNILSIPTMAIFKEGKEIDRLIGVQSKEEILQKIKTLQ